MERPEPSIPRELLIDTSPPRGAISAIRDLDKRTLCGGRVEFTWATCPKKGLPVTAYCQVPACIELKTCPEPMFVPHVDQFTNEVGSPFRRPRKMEVREIIAAVREAARLADGAGPEKRSDRQIARYVGAVWKRTIEAIRGQGNWHP